MPDYNYQWPEEGHKYWRVARECPEMYYGIELEYAFVRQPRNTVQRFNAAVRRLPNDKFIIQDDGSIYRNGDVRYGLEIASMPMSYKWLTTVGKRHWQRVFNLKCHGFKALDSCGMHVHLSRSGFTEKHLYRFMKIIYRNDGFIYRLSGRKRFELMNRWARITGITDEEIAQKAISDVYGPKYTAVNTANENTIELRFFRSTLEPDVFYRNIEFVESLYQFIKRFNSTKLSNYIKFVFDRRDEYERIAKFIADYVWHIQRDVLYST